MNDLPELQGLRPNPASDLVSLPRRQAALETNFCRKGVWHVGPLQLALPLDGEDTLGLLRVSGPPLSLFELDLMAWLTERWREGDRSPRGELRFTRYEMGRDLYDREPSGTDYQTMLEGLIRLQDALFEIEGYDVEAGDIVRLGGPNEKGRIRLIADLAWSMTNRRSRDCRVFLGPWLVTQLEAGYLTYLDWRVLRSLDGLAKRLWVYLESQTFRRSAIGEGAHALYLGSPMLQALGVNTKQASHARRLLLHAGERICAADRSFVGIEMRRPNRRGGTWSMVARRRLTH